MTEPLVSIITPTYRSARTIKETADSVFVQNFSDWEWILVDDGSDDETPEILRQIAVRDPRVRIFLNTQNAGPAVARQKALGQARGRYVAFLDADDLWLPDKLDRQIAAMRDKESAFSFTAYRRLSEDGRIVGRLIPVPATLTYGDLLKNTAIATSTVIVDRVLAGRFSMIDVPYEDYATWLSLLKRGIVARGMQEDFMRYRVRKDSDSSNKRRAVVKVWRIYRRVERLSVAVSAFYTLHYALCALRKRIGF